MNTTPPDSSATAAANARTNETRTTYDLSFDTDSSRSAEGDARPRVEPQLPREIDESVQPVDVGGQACAGTVGPSQDTDRGARGPVLDSIHNDAIAPDRGAESPRR